MLSVAMPLTCSNLGAAFVIGLDTFERQNCIVINVKKLACFLQYSART